MTAACDAREETAAFAPFCICSTTEGQESKTAIAAGSCVPVVKLRLWSGNLAPDFEQALRVDRLRERRLLYHDSQSLSPIRCWKLLRYIAVPAKSE
jgi:hypothetical protein